MPLKTVLKSNYSVTCTPPCPGFGPAERFVEENLPSQQWDGVSRPSLLAADTSQLHCWKRAGQLAHQKWAHNHKVTLRL